MTLSVLFYAAVGSKLIYSRRCTNISSIGDKAFIDYVLLWISSSLGPIPHNIILSFVDILKSKNIFLLVHYRVVSQRG